MARGINLSDLAALADDATLVAGGEIVAAEHNVHRRKVQSLVNNLLTAVRDRESLYAGSGQPIRKVQGKAYFDTDDSLWKGYTANAGTPVVLLESGAAYSQDLANAGSDTFRSGGVLDSDLTDVNATGVLQTMITYNIPANTLGPDASCLSGLTWGTAGADTIVRLRELNENIATTTVKNGVKWIFTSYVVRLASASQKAFALQKNASDGTALTDLATASSISVDETGITLFEMESFVAGDVTEEGAILAING